MDQDIGPSRVDYCNSVLAFPPKTITDHLIYGVCQCDHVTHCCSSSIDCLFQYLRSFNSTFWSTSACLYWDLNICRVLHAGGRQFLPSVTVLRCRILSRSTCDAATHTRRPRLPRHWCMVMKETVLKTHLFHWQYRP